MSWFLDQIGQISSQGGWVFWCLIALAFGIALALLTIVHLLHQLRPDAGDLPISEQQQFALIERRLRFAFVLIGTAPLIGLLGTVGGMMATFDGLAKAVAKAPIDVISGGVSEALITTQTGLVIAVPTFIVASMLNLKLRQRRDAFARLEVAGASPT